MRLVRVYGTDNLETQLLAVKTSAAEAFALAVKIAAEQYPDSFGDIDQCFWDHQEMVEKLRGQRATAIKTLAEGFDADDIEIETKDLLKSARDAGYVKIKFKCAPNCGVAGDDWPERLVFAVIGNEDAAKAKGKIKQPKKSKRAA